MTAVESHEEPWAWMPRLREWLDLHPDLVDAVLALGFDVATSVTLAGETRWWVWLVDQALVLPLAVRRRFPFPVFLAISAAAFCQWLAGERFPADFALFIALYTVAAHESRARTLISGGILSVGAVLAAARFPADASFGYSLIFVLGLVVAATFVGIALRTRRAYLDQVVSSARQLEVDRAREMQLVASEERTRIAREMHDIVAHSLSVMIALADGAAAVTTADHDEAAVAMSTVSSVGRQSLHDMRRLLGVLRDTSRTADRAPQPVLSQLSELTDRMSLIGSEVQVTVHGHPQPLPPMQDATAFRIVQESLTNVVKHAAAATQVSVTLDWAPGQLSIRVIDDGPPSAPPASPSHGLTGMAERASMYGGNLVAGPAPGGGWQVHAILPIGQPA